MNIPDHISESLETIFGVKTLKFFDADPDPGSKIFLTMDLGSWMEKFGSGIKKKPDLQHRVGHKKTVFTFSLFPLSFCIERSQFGPAANGRLVPFHFVFFCLSVNKK
jgi:hypothetical protein